MRSDTKVALAISHVGVKNSQIIHWEGTFAHCIMEFAKWAAKVSMATRFDLCMARTIEEARKGVMIGKRKSTVFPADFDLDTLAEMMNEVEQTESEKE